MNMKIACTEKIQKVEQQVRSILKEWPLYETTDTVACAPLDNGGYSIGYWKGPSRMHGFYFDLNIVKTTCYLLHIEINRPYRGCGHGRALYQVVENIAAGLGCVEVSQYPSGTTFDGKTRREYVEKLGYQMSGWNAIKKLKR